MKNLSNKVALVTRGSRGIGAGIVRRLSNEGAIVAFTFAGNPEKANGLIAELESQGGKVIAILADSASETALSHAVKKTISEFGKLDILVNNAGIGTFAPLEDFSIEDFDKIFAINVRAPFIAIKEAAKHLQRGGRIINIGSINADRMPFAGGGVYAMSKAAVQGLTRGLARDFGPLGITINNVQPGPIDTDMNPASGPFAEMLMPHISVGRYGTASEVGAMVAFLAGDESGYINGASLDIDGGFGN
ncbi:MAG: 3-oxoacyl-ACP reductase FabG [Flavobacterium sp.]|uniref:3-oxoacyl-ACP reductase family protein n=1 Tax=Flavobacterium sp. TaxID=239 RepID=UPI00122B8356|nr:3-oxoacyl-ACP reductase family protein [Flavobacterium sp.]RZJ67014.1 MAG: 3-oxoacyl-ACP reductase FabG [Flavobacterium sp.]